MSPAEEDRLSVAALSEGRLAWLLARYRDELMERWKKRVLEDAEVPGANRLSAPALEDHVPELIKRLLLRLARHPKEAWGERVGREVGSSEVGVAHAQQRFAVHYTLAEALRELSHFRATVLGLSSLLHTTIDEMMATSATELERSSLELHQQAMAVVAHDPRNPLNTIAMYADRMQAGKVAVDPSKAGEVLARSARTMGRLVEDLLTDSKLEGGRFSIHPAKVDVRELARETCEQYGPSARRRKVVLSASTPSTPASPCRGAAGTGRAKARRRRRVPPRRSRRRGRGSLRSRAPPEGRADVRIVIHDDDGGRVHGSQIVLSTPLCAQRPVDRRVLAVGGKALISHDDVARSPTHHPLAAWNGPGDVGHLLDVHSCGGALTRKAAALTVSQKVEKRRPASGTDR